MRIAIAVALGAALGALGTGCAFEAGTFRGRGGLAFDGQPMTLGCLDLSVGRARDDVAEGALLAFPPAAVRRHALTAT